MNDYLSYSLQDLVLFSPDVYFRLLALYNQDVWPVQIIAFGFGLILIWQSWRREHFNDLIVVGILALGWFWCGSVFHITYYATLSWIAYYFGGVFILQGILLFAWSLRGINDHSQSKQTLTFKIGLGLLVFAVFIYPLIWFLNGQHWQTAPLFGTFPNPTVIATIGVLMILRGNSGLFIIPLIFLILNALTSWVVGEMDWIILAIVMLLSLIILIRRWLSHGLN